MHTCPNCNHASIPTWRAFVVPRFLGTKYKCTHCGAAVRLRSRAIDAIGIVPIMMTFQFAIGLPRPQPVGFVMWAFLLSMVAGIALWANFVKYELVEPDDQSLPIFPRHRE